MKSQRTHFLSLPPELGELIFSYLQPAEAAKVLSVCSTFLEFGGSVAYNTFPRLCAHHFGLKQPLILRYGRFVRSWSSDSWAIDYTSDTLEYCSNIRRLEVNIVDVPDLSPAVLDYSAKFSRLQHVTISFESMSLKEVLDGLASVSGYLIGVHVLCIDTLPLSNLQFNGDVAHRELVRFLRNCPRLRELSLPYWFGDYISIMDESELVSLVTGYLAPSLTSLSFYQPNQHQCSGTRRFLRCISNDIVIWYRLIKLTIVICNDDNTASNDYVNSLYRLANPGITMPKLKHFNIINCSNHDGNMVPQMRPRSTLLERRLAVTTWATTELAKRVSDSMMHVEKLPLSFLTAHVLGNGNPDRLGWKSVTQLVLQFSINLVHFDAIATSFPNLESLSIDFTACVDPAPLRDHFGVESTSPLSSDFIPLDIILTRFSRLNTLHIGQGITLIVAGIEQLQTEWHLAVKRLCSITLTNVEIDGSALCAILEGGLTDLVLQNTHILTGDKKNNFSQTLPAATSLRRIAVNGSKVGYKELVKLLALRSPHLNAVKIPVGWVRTMDTLKRYRPNLALSHF
ncbi:hypothetical protein GQ42DRAFT_43239 [Ramicandelaber brevisporus]|nr:hypothetical protein GQ42DRAFT_43239 [Ramicandelaber brevisporus]